MTAISRSIWVRNLQVLAVGVFFAGMGSSKVTPIINVYRPLSRNQPI